MPAAGLAPLPRGPSATPTTTRWAGSFFATLECERLDRRTYRAQAKAKLDLFQYLEGWYNPHRRHSAIGNQWPMAYERLNAEAA